MVSRNLDRWLGHRTHGSLALSSAKGQVPVMQTLLLLLIVLLMLILTKHRQRKTLILKATCASRKDETCLARAYLIVDCKAPGSSYCHQLFDPVGFVVYCWKLSQKASSISLVSFLESTGRAEIHSCLALNRRNLAFAAVTTRRTCCSAVTL